MTDIVKNVYAKYVIRQPIAGAVNRLAEELSPCFTYHSVAHTLDVLQELGALCELGGVTEKDAETLLIAGAFHDFGFLVSKEGEEEIAAQMAAEVLESFAEFERDRILHVQQLILDTKMIEGSGGWQQSPRARLSGYLLDADLANFGREDFFERMEALRLEKEAAILPFQEQTLRLLESHEWRTRAAHQRYGKGKEDNIQLLRCMVDNAHRGR